MTGMDPSSAEYREALRTLRRVAPDAASVVSGYVAATLRLLAAAKSEQAGTATRIQDLSRQAVAVAPADSETFVVVDGETVSMTSTADLAETAIALVDQLRQNANTPAELAAILQAVSTRDGPVAVAVFAAALQVAIMTSISVISLSS